MRIYLPLLLSIVLLSCDTQEILFEQVQNTGQIAWDKDEAMKFQFEVADTSQYLDITLDIHNTDDYGYSNFYLFVNMKFPNERWLRDTLECYLADRSGRWIGKYGDGRYANKLLYKYNRKMPLPGTYELNLIHGMREDELKGLSQVGISVAVHEN